MNTKIFAVLLTSMFVFNTAKANDDALWALGGFLLGRISADRDHNPPRREPLPPPYRQPRVVPIYTTICEYVPNYDYYGNRNGVRQFCHQEITGYREIYD